ncbi:MAG: hypothetical protein K2X87_08070 [Gemmataceae bacterium]|nr:hypothetical protein [Gemmataceae bacterium]
MSIDDLDGSACAVLGRFERRARLHGWSEGEVDRVVQEALAGDRDHLLRTIAGHIDDGAHGAATAAAAAPAGAAGGGEAAGRLQALAGTFPSLRAAPGASPWDPHALDGWACDVGLPPVPAFSAQFVLAVCDPWLDWDSGPFDLMEAMAAWDAAHRAAFRAWAADPWWGLGGV